MVSYWCLQRGLNNIFRSRSSIKISAQELHMRLLVNPLPRIDHSLSLSPITGDARFKFSQFHHQLVNDLQYTVCQISAAVDPLVSATKKLKQLIRHHLCELIKEMELYGQDVLITLHNSELHADLTGILNSEFSIILHTICLFLEIYGLKDWAEELKLDLEFLSSTKVFEEPLPTKCLSPEQSLRRLKKAFPDERLPHDPTELAKDANEGPIIVEAKTHRGRLKVLFTMATTAEEDEQEAMKESTYPGDSELDLGNDEERDAVMEEPDCPGELESEFEYDFRVETRGFGS